MPRVHSSYEPIAIIGMACRLPGGIRTPAALWQALMRGEDLITEVPPWRFDIAGFYHPERGKAGHTYCRWGGFLDDIDQLDPAFFGISPAEAPYIDPQQRLVLQSAWHALEDAGIGVGAIRGSPTGVYVGAMNKDYYEVGAATCPPESLSPYSGPGGAPSVISGRVAYVLDAHGPAVTIDTACSSGLVATHMACQALRLGDIQLGIASGVNVILLPHAYVTRAQALMLSASGRCRTFAASADGYVPAEGCATLILKRLEDAERDGDRIHAVIAATATNQDGRTAVLTAPSVDAQKALLSTICRLSDTDPAAVQYVEAHGTGTPRGDPIEATAIGEALGKRGEEQRGGPLLVGSLKANLGHLESGAGTASLIKVALAIEHGMLPPHLHLDQVNPRIDLDALGLEIPVTPTPWPYADEVGSRCAVLNSFGWSGTNASAMLVGYDPPPRPPPSPETDPLLLCLSAPTAASLSALTEAVRQKLVPTDDAQTPAPPIPGLAEVCRAAHACRSDLAARASLVLDEGSAADLARVDAPLRELRGRVTRSAPRVGFLFSGQGAHYAQMGLPACERFPVFAEIIDRCDAAVFGILGKKLRTIFASTELLSETLYAQPAIFALSLALDALWRDLGITPVAVLGHSLGELSAATAAGILSLEDGARTAVERGRLVQDEGPRGSMAAVLTTVSRLQQALPDLLGSGADAAQDDSGVVLAAYNAPNVQVIAGTSEAVDAAVATLSRLGLHSRMLASKWAFHTPGMTEIEGRLAGHVAHLELHAPQAVFVSACRGRALSAAEAAEAEYWGEQLVAPVRFSDGLAAMAEAGCDVLVELGPGSTLSSLAARHEGLPPSHASFIPSSPLRQLFSTVGALYEMGASIRWAGLDPQPSDARPRQPDALPLTPTVGKRYWAPKFDGRKIRAPASHVAPFDTAIASEVANGHRVGDEAWVPAAAMLLAMEQAATEHFCNSGTATTSEDVTTAVVALQDVAFFVPLPASRAPEATVRILATEADAGNAGNEVLEVVICLAEHDSTTVIAKGRARRAPCPLDEGAWDSARPPSAEDGRAPVEGEQVYARLAGRGLHLAGPFRRIESFRPAEASAEGWLELAADGAQDEASYSWLERVCDLDAMLHGVLCACPPGLFVPSSVQSRVCCSRPVTAHGDEVLALPRPRSVFYRLRPSHGARGEDPRGIHAEIWAWNDHREPVAHLRATFRFLDRDGAASADVLWLPSHVSFATPDTAAVAAPAPERAAEPVILTPATAEAAELAARLQSALSGRARICSTLPAEQGPLHVIDLRPVAEQSPTPGDALPALTRALAWIRETAQRETDIRVTWVTQGGSGAGSSAAATAHPLQAALFTLGKVAVRELPSSYLGCIDLPHTLTDDDVALCARLLRESEDGHAVGIAGAKAYALESVSLGTESLPPQTCLAMQPLQETARGGPGALAAMPPPLPSRALITGGTGGLGDALAQALAERGAETVVLVSRRGPSEALRKRIAQWQAYGTRVCVAEADVAGDATRLRQALRAAADDYGPFDAVIHAAGMVEDGGILSQSPEQVARVLAPKVTGTAALCDALANDLPPPGDGSAVRVLLFSSISAPLGWRRQANYAAANAWMEAYGAQWRQRMPHCAVSTLALGPWSEVGMAAAMTPTGSDMLQASGLKQIPPDKGVAAVLAALARWPMPAHLAIADLVPPHASVVDALPAFMKRFLPHPDSLDAWASAVIQHDADRDSRWGVAPPIVLPDGYADLSLELRRDAVVGALGRAVRKLLYMTDDEPLEADQSLFDAGLDSYSAAELVKQINASLHMDLHPGWAFEHPTLSQQADFVVKRL